MDLHQPTSDGIPKNLWKQITLFLLTFGVLFVCALVLLPFLSAIVGAIVLAVVTQRPYNRLALRIKNRNTTAAIAVVLVILSVIIPTFFVVQSLSEQALNVVNTMRRESTQQMVTAYFYRHPSLAGHLKTASDTFDYQRIAQTIAAYLGSGLAGLLGHSIWLITQSFIMLFILFFLYRDRELAITFLRSLLPLQPQEASQLLAEVRGTINATILGRLAIAGVQGVLCGVAFWALGVPRTAFWTMMTVIVAIIPAIGTFLIWLPIALYLGFTGSWGKAAILIGWGAFVVSTIDNFLYPLFVGSQISQHTVGILLSILGGVSVFGLPGLILGPIAFTVAVALLNFWRARTIVSAKEPAITPPPQI
ncbi:MAG TPA: AI-2E family transporter [Edaphobacter sp.]